MLNSDKVKLLLNKWLEFLDPKVHLLCKNNKGKLYITKHIHIATLRKILLILEQACQRESFLKIFELHSSYSISNLHDKHSLIPTSAYAASVPLFSIPSSPFSSLNEFFYPLQTSFFVARNVPDLSIIHLRQTSFLQEVTSLQQTWYQNLPHIPIYPFSAMLHCFLFIYRTTYSKLFKEHLQIIFQMFNFLSLIIPTSLSPTLLNHTYSQVLLKKSCPWWICWKWVNFHQEYKFTKKGMLSSIILICCHKHKRIIKFLFSHILQYVLMQRIYRYFLQQDSQSILKNLNCIYCAIFAAIIKINGS